MVLCFYTALGFKRLQQSEFSTSPALSFLKLLLQTRQNLPMVVSPLLHVFEERLVSLTETDKNKSEWITWNIKQTFK